MPWKIARYDTAMQKIAYIQNFDMSSAIILQQANTSSDSVSIISVIFETHCIQLI